MCVWIRDDGFPYSFSRHCKDERRCLRMVYIIPREFEGEGYNARFDVNPAVFI